MDERRQLRARLEEPLEALEQLRLFGRCQLLAETSLENSDRTQR